MTDPLGQSQVLPYLTGLSKQGYQFTLLSFEKKDRYIKSGKLIEDICKEYNIRWVPEFFSSRPPLLSKLYDNYKMKRRVRKLQQEENFAFTHCRSYVAAAAGLRLLKKFKTPFLFDMRGFWVDERVDNGQWNLRNPVYKLAYKYFKKKEKKYLEQSAHIISLTEKGKCELVENYQISKDKISVIPCCVDFEHFDPEKIDNFKRNELKLKLGIKDDEKVLSYLGSLGGWYLLDEMLDFFKVLKMEMPGFKFLFITQDSKEVITGAALKKGISGRDIIVQPASRMEVPLFLSLSDWSIFFIKDAYSKKASSPTKQGEIMAMGVPVICNDIGDTGIIVKESNAGIVVRDLNTSAYKNAVGLLMTLLTKKKEDIRNAAFKYYNLETGVLKYAKVYNRLLQ